MFKSALAVFALLMATYCSKGARAAEAKYAFPMTEKTCTQHVECENKYPCQNGVGRCVTNKCQNVPACPDTLVCEQRGEFHFECRECSNDEHCKNKGEKSVCDREVHRCREPIKFW